MALGPKRQFAGELRGTAENNPRTYGTKERGMTSEVGGWNGMVRTYVWHENGKDRFTVWLIPHWSVGGPTTLLAEGILNCEITDPFIVPSIFA